MMTDKNPMDPLYEVHALAGETLALQAVLFGILPRLAAVSPEIKAALGAGFDDAANLVEQIALKYGDQAHPRTRPRLSRSSREFAQTPSANLRSHTNERPE
jgi:hypothetical protein